MNIPSILMMVLVAAVALAGFTARDDAEQTASPAISSPSDLAAWSVDNVHSHVGFKVKHLGISNVRGDFSDYDVTLRFDPDDLSTLETSATIRVASISTENEKRDNHLRSPDFFSADAHPEMTFVSKEVRNLNGTTFELVGDLTIRDVTKGVVMDVEYLGSATMMGQERAAFEAETTINRLDYGLAWDKLTETGGFVVGHEVTILLDLEVTRADA